MKILMIGWGFENSISGGMDVHITRVAKSLAGIGAQVHLYLPSFNTSQPYEKNITIHTINTNSDQNDMFRMVQSYNRSIIKEAKNLDFDTVHSHDWLGVAGAKAVSKKNNAHWIHTVHSLEYMRCGKDDITSGTIADIEKHGIEDSDTIITVSNLMKKEILQNYNIPPSKVHVIYNHTSGLKKQAHDIIPKHIEKIKANPKILCISRLTFQKGTEYLIYAAPEILKNYPDSKFIIVGDGHNKKSLEQFAEILGVKDSFIFSGFAPREELNAYLTHADIFVMPSVHEPFGISCLDAIDFNVPVVVSENVGAKELLEGCVATHKTRSSKDIAEKITKLLSDKSYSDNLRDCAKKKLASIDNWDTIAKKVLKVYGSVRP